MTGEELHSHLDQIEKIHGLYSPTALGFAAALACGAFTFLLGGGPVETVSYTHLGATSISPFSEFFKKLSAPII